MEQISEECECLKNQLNLIEQDKDSFDSQHKDLIDKLYLKDVLNFQQKKQFVFEIMIFLFFCISG
jgi:hypothetical protein